MPRYRALIIGLIAGAIGMGISAETGEPAGIAGGVLAAFAIEALLNYGRLP